MGNYRMVKTRIIIITDAWDPQVNGVVTTYKNIIKHINNVDVNIIHPDDFKNFELPFYKGIKIPLVSKDTLYKIIQERSNNYKTYYHIATEGWLGLLAKLIFDENKISYTTAYHTKFPEFFKSMYKIPISCTKWYFEWFHKKSKYMLCSSKSSAKEQRNLNAVVLDKGYDKCFSFYNKIRDDDVTLLYVGRISKEKNIEKFLNLDFKNHELNFKKVVVGNGPELESLKSKYPEVEFAGYKFHNELADYYKNADVFVFPSTNDTFGIVVLEAMACGTPVAAFNVTGPRDQIIEGTNGYMDKDLKSSIIKCLSLDREKVRDSVKHVSWKNSSKQFLKYILE